MRATTAFLFGTSIIAIAAPAAAAQTTPEQQAQAAQPQTNPPPVPVEEQGAIIVTATKRASTVQDVPFSVNAQTQADIQRANAQTIEDISRNVAGLTVQNLGPGQSQVSVRGVSAGQIVRDQPGVKEQVGIYLDESVVSLSLFTPDFDLFDLNRVETLRGPQGTLFGSGSVGGTIRYITNQPRTDRLEGTVEGGVNVLKGGDVGYDAKFALNVPMSDQSALRLVGYHTHFGGFVDAVGPASGKNINDGNRTGMRASLLWQPAPQVKITPRLVYQEANANGFNREEFYNLYDNQFTTSGGADLGERTVYRQLQEKFRDKTALADLTVSYDFGPVELTSVSSKLWRDILVSRDASALTGSVTVSFAEAFLGTDPTRSLAIAQQTTLPSNLRDTTKLNQFTQELRLASTGHGPLQWVFGGFYSNVHRQYHQRLPTPGYDVAGDLFLQELCFDQAQASATCKVNAPLPANRVPFTSADAAISNGFPLNSPYNADLPYVIKQKALFGEASYKFNQFKVTAGGRWYDFKERRNFISGGIFSNGDTRIGDKTKSNGFSPRGILSWEPSRRLSVNLQVAKGFRLGGVNDPLNIPLCSGGATGVDAQTFGNHPTYKDETLWNYEAGVKYSRRGITFNAAAFYNDIRNLQVTADAGSCSSRVVFNVPKAHSKGIEAEFSAHPIVGLDLSLAGSLLNSEFDSSVTSTTGAIIAGIRDGNRLPTVPKYQVAATATYGTRLTENSEWYVNGSVQRIGSRFTQPGDQEVGAGIFDSLFYDPVTGAFGDRPGTNFGSLRLPAYTLVNASLGVKWDSGLELVGYVNNIFDKDPKLSLDRERGGRARLGYNIGQPRTIGLTVRQTFGRRVAEAAPPPVVAPPPPPPATQTCPDGSVVAATATCPTPPPPAPPPPPATQPERG
jgi:iron complex outermembrane receptor protein